MPRSLATVAPPFRDEALPDEVGLLLPNRDTLALTLQALETDPDGAAGQAVGLFLADPFLDPLAQAERLKARGLRWVANLPSVVQHDPDFARQLTEVGVDRTLELERLAAFRDAGFGALAVVADGGGAERAVSIDPAVLFVIPRVADFAAGFPSFRQRGAAALEVRRAAAGGNWSGPILGLGDKAEAGHESLWPEALDGLVLRPAAD